MGRAVQLERDLKQASVTLLAFEKCNAEARHLNHGVGHFRPANRPAWPTPSFTSYDPAIVPAVHGAASCSEILSFPASALRADPPETKRILGLGLVRLMSFL
jgi:hypothetical protein